jgi:nucleoside-diphosphate-sugar epimerase
MNPKKVLILGAGGAMGQYLVPYLAEKGCKVDAVALNEINYENPAVTWYKGNAKDWGFRNELLAKNYDAVIDFLVYPSREVPFYLPQMLDSTGHYVYISSGRIYDNLERPVRETSPRLIDTCKDPLLINSDDYCIYKARGENILTSSGKKNWTIVRPATTYSFMRYQLVTLEARDNVGRAFAGKDVVVPIQAKEKPASLSWGKDVARMIGELLFCDGALCEAFNVNSAESRTWGEIADYYKDICNLNAVWVDKEDYLKIVNPNPYELAPRWQLEYARLFDREVDNSKVLSVTGLKQEDMMPLYDGLKYEISRTPRDIDWGTNVRMDEYLAAMKH